jgi:hypothetical protein
MRRQISQKGFAVMGEYLDFLLKGSIHHKVEQLDANTFRITAANDSAECHAKFDEIVRTARVAAGEDFGVLPHEYKRAPGREFDMAIITVENGGRQT